MKIEIHRVKESMQNDCAEHKAHNHHHNEELGPANNGMYQAITWKSPYSPVHMDRN